MGGLAIPWIHVEDKEVSVVVGAVIDERSRCYKEKIPQLPPFFVPLMKRALVFLLYEEGCKIERG